MEKCYLSALFVVLLFVVGTQSQLPPHPVTFIPTLFVTSEPEAPKPDAAFIYVANICSPKLFAPYMVIARLNMPNGWKPFIGLVAKLEVCTTSACDNLICSNFKNGAFNGLHNCSFPYNTTYNQVYIRATAGTAPNIAWTVALEFVPKANFVKSKEFEYKDVPEPIARNEISLSDVKTLQQIIPPGIHQSVTTLNRLDFSLSFCPDQETTKRYNIDIVVTATDSRSAMATYVCLPPNIGDKCTPSTSTHSDPRGIGINVVTLQTGSGTLKDVYVAVVGWGDGEQENHFLIGATIKRYLLPFLVVVYSAQLPPHPVTFIPTLYITDAPDGPRPHTAVMYVANICSPTLYAPYMAIANVNMPNGWKPFIGVVAKLEVCATLSCDNVICSNFVDGVFNGQHSCSFAYNTTYKQIYVRVTAGYAPNLAWTVALEFVTQKMLVTNGQIQYVDVQEPMARNKISPNDVKPLAQIVQPAGRQMVTTLNRRDFSLTFCPDSLTTQRYSIDVIVTATNSRSAMATYICLPPVTSGQCTPSTATYNDPRGIAINIITINTKSGSLKDIYIAVIGWGDGEQENHFVLGATIKKDS